MCDVIINRYVRNPAHAATIAPQIKSFIISLFIVPEFYAYHDS